MDNLAQIIASCFVNSLWEVALVGGAAWMVSRLFKRLGPGVQHLMWVTSLMLAVITPFLPLLRLVLADIGFRTVPQDHSFLISAATRGSQPLSSGGLLVSQSSVLTLFFLFFGVLVFYATRLAWSLHYTIALRREAYPISLAP